jgi:hypothetical protein
LQAKIASSSTVYPLGDCRFSQLYVAAILAEAERRMEESVGMEEANYQSVLARCIVIDQESEGPFLGYLGDNSDAVYEGGAAQTNRHQYWTGHVQYSTG